MENEHNAQPIDQVNVDIENEETSKCDLEKENKENTKENIEGKQIENSKDDSQEQNKEESEKKEDTKRNPSKNPAVTLKMLPTWTVMAKDELEEENLPEIIPKYSPNQEINNLVTFYRRGNSARLEVDGIVNAANALLTPGGGICGVLHSGAGPLMAEECRKIGYTNTGECAVTKGYNLPAKYCIHAVGPIGEHPDMLQKVYESVLGKIDGEKIRSIGFCCISTGIYGYPSSHAAPIALETVRKWLEIEENRAKCDRIVFVLFERKDIVIYDELKHVYFPIPGVDYKQLKKEEEEEELNEEENKSDIDNENKDLEEKKKEKPNKNKECESQNEADKKEEGEINSKNTNDEEYAETIKALKKINKDNKQKKLQKNVAHE